jgi:hypothetical protein
MKLTLVFLFGIICSLANGQEAGKFNYEILSSDSYNITPKFEKQPEGERFGAEVESYDGEWMGICPGPVLRAAQSQYRSITEWKRHPPKAKNDN